MTYRIGWLSPLTPASGIGTFTQAVTRHFPSHFEREPIDLTILHAGHDRLYDSEHRAVRIGEDETFHRVLSLFDLLVYNIGNNREHHEPIYALLRRHPGVVICHDFVYQDYLADRSQRSGGSFASLAALLLAYAGDAGPSYLRRSRFTSRLGRARYRPWGSLASVEQPMSEALVALGSAVVVHSDFAQRHAERSGAGPILRLGMPHDQKDLNCTEDLAAWTASLATKGRFELVSFGHIQATKCIDLVIAALASSPTLRRRIHYTVAGFVCNAAYFDHVKDMVATLSLADCVTFDLAVSEARLAELMQSADIFSNLRRPNTEGGSVSLIEQLGSGKPVLVMDSGAYADIPAGAAVKLPARATSGEIADALQRLIDDPASMPAIGQAGRSFARRWSCASYAEGLLRFAHAHRGVLEARGRFVAASTKPLSDPVGADPWVRDLARARRSLAYLDRNMLALDPELVLHRPHKALCDYVAHVVFGLFDDAPLEQALSRFFVRLDRSRRYWACVRLAIVADAAFGDDAAARERLVRLRPCYDPEFWSVIVALPVRQCLVAASLMLAQRLPSEVELSTAGPDDVDGFPKRLRIADLVASLDPPPASDLAQLGLWLGAGRAPGAEAEVRQVGTDFDATVGSPRFKERIDLSGFHMMEENRVWTRGRQGFIGLRLDERPVTIDVLVHHICASAGRPASIGLSHDAIETKIEADDCVPRWLSITLPAVTGDARIVWLELSTDLTAVPDASADTRLLGLCLLRLKIGRSQETALVDEPPGAAPDSAPHLSLASG